MKDRTTPGRLWEIAGQLAHSRWSFEYELVPTTFERTGRIRDAQFHTTPRRLAIPPSQRRAVEFT